jgi:hypothetical protein
VKTVRRRDRWRQRERPPLEVPTVPTLGACTTHRRQPPRVWFRFRISARPLQCPRGARTDPRGGCVQEFGSLRLEQIMSACSPPARPVMGPSRIVYRRNRALGGFSSARVAVGLNPMRGTESGPDNLWATTPVGKSTLSGPPLGRIPDDNGSRGFLYGSRCLGLGTDRNGHNGQYGVARPEMAPVIKQKARRRQRAKFPLGNHQRR